MQFSIADLDLKALTINTVSSQSGVATQIDLTHTLSESNYDPLTPFGSEQNYVFLLGANEVQASIDSEGVITFVNLEQLLSLEGEDVLALSLQLVDQQDRGNILYEITGLPLLRLVDGESTTALTTAVTRTHYESVLSNNDNINQKDFDDSYIQRSFKLSAEADVSLVLKDEKGEVVSTLINASKLPPGIVHHFAISYGDIADAGILPRIGEDDYQLEIKAVSRDSRDAIVNQQAVKYTGNINKAIRGNMLGQIIQHDVLIQNGSLSLYEQDLNLPGLGPDLSFNRSYGNRSSNRGDMGIGWSHNLDIVLTKNAVGQYNTPGHLPETVILNQGRFFTDNIGQSAVLGRISISNGGQFNFNGAEWVAQRGYHGTLDAVDNASGGGFNYRSKDGTLYYFANGVGNQLPVRYIEDRNGNRLTYQYETLIENARYKERIINITDAINRRLDFDYTALPYPYGDRLTHITGPDGISLSFSYNTEGNLSQVLRDDDSRYSLNYTYEADGRDGSWNLLTATDQNNHTTTYDYYNLADIPPAKAPIAFIPGYNEQDLVKSVTYADGAQPTFNYALDTASPTIDQNRRQVTDARGNTTSYYLTAVGNPRRIEEPLGKTTQMTWSLDQGLADNVMTSRTDAEGRLWQYEYDTRGNVTLETDPFSNTTTRSWNQFSQLLTRIDRNGNNITNTYDANGNLLTQEDAEQNVTTHTYNALGLRKTTTSPRGATYITNYTYDSLGFLQTQLEAEGSLTRYDYDIRGRLLSKTDANLNRTDFTYNALDWLTKRDDADGASVNYDHDAKGNKTQEITRQGITTDYTYDERDRVASASRSGAFITTGNMAYDYDDNGNLISETDWKNVATTHNYDELNRRDITTNREGERMTYGYDLVGNKTAMTDYEGRTQRNEYDLLDRLTKTIAYGLIENDANDRTTLQTYDFETNLASITDAEGRTTQYAYDKRYLRTLQTDARTGTYQWNYDEVGNLIAEINENTVSTAYVYDKQNRRTEMRTNDGTSADYLTTFVYDANNNLTRTTDPRNNTRTTSYDELNRPLVKTDFGGFPMNYTYTNAGRTINVTDARNITRLTETDGLDRQIRQTQGDGGEITQTYDANGNNTQISDARNLITAISYDLLDRPITIIEAQGQAAARTLKKEYDRVGNLTADIDGRNLRTEYTYDGFNQLQSSKDPAPFNYTMAYRYDKVGNKLSETDRRGNTTTFAYDDLDRLTSVTDPAPFSAQTQAYTYDPASNRLSEKDKRGTVTSHTYDDLNRLTQSSKPDGQGATVLLIRNEYDGNNNITAITDANNNRTQLSYNKRNLLERTTYADVTTETRSYDPEGNLKTHTDEIGQINTYEYDPENRLASDTNHAQEKTAYTYDTNGNRTQLTKPELNGWTYTYDGLNRLKTATNSLSHITTYEYDNNDNLSAQIDAENKRVEYAYDALDRRTQHTQLKTSGNLIVTFNYDENANMTGRTDAKGQAFTYGFDALNRETTRTYPAETTPFINNVDLVTAYDANNNLTSLTENKTQSGTAITDITINTYDRLDRLLSSDQRGKAISYTYDNNGNRNTVSTAAGNTRYTYDNRNRLKTATDIGTTTYDYFGDSKQQQVNFPNGTQTRYTYDDADRITNITSETTPALVLISQYQYTYDSNGNRTQQTETQNGTSGVGTDTTTYGYDTADRMENYTLVTSANITTVNTYGLDNVSNRKTEIVTSDITGSAVDTTNKTYTYDDTHWLNKVTDKLQSLDIDYSYDANGNTTQKLDPTKTSAEQSTVFIYNSRDQLVQTQRGPPASETTLLGLHDYNAAGLRVRHYNSERGDINYYYDDNAIIEERTSADALLAHYRYADRLLSLQTDTETSYYHHDALGSTTNLTDSTGATKVSYKLDPWGHITDQVGSSVNRQVFTGQEMDEQTGLIYFGARFYDPDTARFLNQDSYLGESGTPPSLHRYLYAYGNPTVYIDLNGNSSSLARRLAKPKSPVVGPVDDGFFNEGPPSLYEAASNYISNTIDTLKRGFDALGGVDDGGLDFEADREADEQFARDNSPNAYVTTEDRGANPEPTSFPRAKPIDSSTDSTPVPVDTSSTEFPADEGPKQGTPGFPTDGPQSGNSTADTNGVGQVNTPNVMLNESGDQGNKTRVGQWMSPKEFDKFVETGEIPRTNVLVKGKEGFERQADEGDFYVEFDIDKALLVEKNKELGWALIKSKNAMHKKLAERKGQALAEPIGTRIEHKSIKE